MSIKRNDPCNCGSGKKYKKCCMQMPAGGLSAKELLGCLQSLYPVLEHHALQRFGGVVNTAGWKDFSRWGEASIAHEQKTYHMAFTAWQFFAWLPDDHDMQDERFTAPAPDHAIAADYLTLHRATLSPLEQKLIERALTSPYSFYAIVSIESDNRLLLQDIYTQKHIMVENDAAGLHMVGDVIFSAVLSVDGVSVLLGCMPHALDAQSQVRLETHRKKWRQETGKAIDRRQLYLHDSELRRFYFLLLNQKQLENLH